MWGGPWIIYMSMWYELSVWTTCEKEKGRTLHTLIQMVAVSLESHSQSFRSTLPSSSRFCTSNTQSRLRRKSYPSSKENGKTQVSSVGWRSSTRSANMIRLVVESQQDLRLRRHGSIPLWNTRVQQKHIYLTATSPQKPKWTTIACLSISATLYHEALPHEASILELRQLIAPFSISLQHDQPDLSTTVKLNQRPLLSSRWRESEKRSDSAGANTSITSKRTLHKMHRPKPPAYHDNSTSQLPFEKSYDQTVREEKEEEPSVKKEKKCLHKTEGDEWDDSHSWQYIHTFIMLSTTVLTTTATKSQTVFDH